MNIDKAMIETRRYFVLSWSPDAFTIGTNRPDVSLPSLDCTFKTRVEAQIVCDRLNLIAVLEAIREPSEAMVWAPPSRANQSPEDSMYAGIYRTMIDALIAEVGK